MPCLLIDAQEKGELQGKVCTTTEPMTGSVAWLPSKKLLAVRFVKDLACLALKK